MASDVYNAYEMTDQQINDLSDAVVDMGQAAYLDRINRELMAAEWNRVTRAARDVAHVRTQSKLAPQQEVDRLVPVAWTGRELVDEVAPRRGLGA